MSSGAPRRSALLVAALIVGLAGPILAQPPAHQLYRVQQKDTLDVIAAEFYGDRSHAIYIMVENKMPNRRPLRAGERLRVPVTRQITTAKGDTFESLAESYLGDSRRAPFLADYNQLSVLDTPPTGTPLTIPFHVTHTPAGNETLVQIARTYLGDGKQAEVIKRYNALDKNTIEKGESIAVPILHVRVRAPRLPGPDAEARIRQEERTRVEKEAALALPFARTAWLQGEFAQLRDALAPIEKRLDMLDSATAVELALLLGKAHVAFDDSALAVAAFTEVLNRRPTYVLSAYADSPKVIEAWKKAGGRLHGE
jgi:LysM repeat protein